MKALSSRMLAAMLASVVVLAVAGIALAGGPTDCLGHPVDNNPGLGDQNIDGTPGSRQPRRMDW
jgi:hypothetical protein